MPDIVRVRTDIDIIMVESYGQVSEADIMNSIKEVQQISDETGINKILVDTTQQETMPIAGKVFRLFASFPHDLKLALLFRKEQVTAAEIEFAKTVSSNRGALVRIFQQEAQAIDWLNEGQ